MDMVIEQDLIDQYVADGVDFFSRVLQMDYHRVLTTDLSTLSDFSFNGMPKGALDPTEPLKTLYAKWDAFIKDAVKREYGLELPHTRLTLIDLFERLRELKRPPTVH